MSTLAPDEPRAIEVQVTDTELVVSLEDGRVLHVPREWFPALRDAPPDALKEWRLIGGGVGIHWPQLDEDLSVRGLLMPTSRESSRQVVVASGATVGLRPVRFRDTSEHPDGSKN